MRMIAALDDHGQVSAAAQVLNISQPAASRMIAEMEDMLGVKLCERLPRGVALTPYGKALARRARTMLLEMREADREISDLKSGQGRLGVPRRGDGAGDRARGAGDPARSARTTRASRSPCRSTPASCWRESCSPRATISSSRASPTTSIRGCSRARVIGIEKACLIVRRGHPLSRGKAVRLERLAAYDWVFQPGGSLLRRTDRERSS